MPFVNASRKNENLQLFQIATKADADIAADWLRQNGYPTGRVEWHPDPANTDLPRVVLVFTDKQATEQYAYLGWYIALTYGTRATAYSPQQADAAFTIT